MPGEHEGAGAAGLTLAGSWRRAAGREGGVGGAR